jgi:hypothetical protein
LTTAPAHAPSPVESQHDERAPAHAPPREAAQSEAPDFESAPVIASPFYEPVAETALAVPVAPIERAPAPVLATPEAKPAPVPDPKPVVVSRPIPELPPVSLTLPPDSGLELVETRFKPAPSMEAESPVPAGPRRVRPPKVTIVEEPLQIVETQRTPLPPAS